MPRALVLTAPRTLEFEEVPERPLAPNEVRIRTLFSGISAGTELSQYRASSPFMAKSWDEGSRLFRPSERPSWPYPVRNLGYEEVGEIVETGSGVLDLRVGQRVFGSWGHRTEHIATSDFALPRLLSDGADPRIGIFSHIGAVALNGVHDAGIRIGDLVVVFGLGVPGQIVAQAARRSGATVIGVDPVPDRRAKAIELGAAEALDPTALSVAEAIKDKTGGRGADVVIEVTGNASALNEAIRTAAYSARVVALGFFQGEANGLRLGEEFHHNRINLVCSQISGVAPEASYRWTKLRLWQTAVRLQHEGVLDLLPLITDVAPFEEAPSLFARLDAGAQGVLQSMLRFDGAP